MLAGIKTGKKKKQKTAPKHTEEEEKEEEEDGRNAASTGRMMDSCCEGGGGGEQQPPNNNNDQNKRRPPLTGNEAVAAALRRQGLSLFSSSPSTTSGGAAATAAPATAATTILLLPQPGSSTTTTTTMKAEDEMTMAELLVHEKMQMSLAEQEAKSILRQKRPPRKTMDNSGDEEETGDNATEVGQKKRKKQQSANPETARRRDQNRCIAHLRKTEGVTHQCWWWIESTRFSERQLLVASSAVTLTMNQSQNSLVAGHHFFLTPIPHTPAMASCDDEMVWSELRHYQTSLRSMAAAMDNNMAVIFWETVLPNHTNNNHGRIWQTRFEAMLVPLPVLQDAPLYFRSALSEQAEEWGTHQKLRTINQSGGLRHAVPLNFSYFYVEYAPDHAHLQMIEKTAFPPDFGVDTIAGIMDLEPIRMRRRLPPQQEDGTTAAASNEQGLKESFLAKYKRFDWTQT
jgi:Protein similar to CwfJ C-terminus 2/Protein similar to CwfJ C-terminus 1